MMGVEKQKDIAIMFSFGAKKISNKKCFYKSRYNNRFFECCFGVIYWTHPNHTAKEIWFYLYSNVQLNSGSISY